jgi:serine protease Do
LKTSVDYGIYIKDVFDGLPADEAGLNIWDIVVSINDTLIDSTMPFLYQLYTYKPWNVLSLSVVRDKNTMIIPLVLGANN